jgi:molybdate transport system substrate-binding protein
VRRSGLLVLQSMVLLIAACSDSGVGGSTGGSASGSGDRELTVSAASSLTDAFGDIGQSFEAQNASVTVTFNFGPSDGLAAQINEGAPVDVFASASPSWMDFVEDEGPDVSGRTDFAQNRLAIIVPADNPAGIEDINDLTEDGVQIVLAAKGVPAGDYAREIFDDAGNADAALANVVSNEEDVRAVVTKVLSGDADAGITYVTDVTPDVADQITLIPIPRDLNVIATYPIAVVTGSQETDLAQRFVDYVVGEGQGTLADYGFRRAA